MLVIPGQEKGMYIWESDVLRIEDMTRMRDIQGEEGKNRCLNYLARWVEYYWLTWC